MKIRVGSRKSDLAQIQSRIVAARLKEIIPSLEVEFVFKDVAVDLNLGISLVAAESKGLFTKDLSTDLIEGKIDLVVHSWKDLPTTGPEQTVVAATLEREDPRDLVFVKNEAFKKEFDNHQSIHFLSSSPRREHNLGDFIKNYVFTEQEIRFVAVRGNLPTRINKFLKGNEDALVLALAAVKRLLQYGNEESKAALKKVLETSQVLVVPVTENPPAPAQGALAIEVRKDRKDLTDLLGKINHKQSFEDVLHERERLKDFGGGCHLKLGIYQKTTPKGVLKVERGLSPKGNELSLKDWNIHKKIPKVSEDRFFDASQLKIFDRKKIENTSECKTKKHVYLVSKTEALPEDWVSPNDVLWVAGLESWKKLRAKGYWVSGSYEGLGQTFQDIPYELWPEHLPLKLAHSQAVQGPESFCATYELVRNSEKIPSLEPFDLFFWPSGSLFLACMKEQPAIREKHHICGLGNTFDELSKHIPAERLYSVLGRDYLL